METRNKSNFMYSGICDWILLTGDEFWQMSFYKTKNKEIKILLHIRQSFN